MMRKIFALLVLGLLLSSATQASWRRTQPVYSFERAEKVKNDRYTRSKWRTTRTLYRYRFSPFFQRNDYLQWRTLTPKGSSAEEIEAPISKDFCNYSNSMIGEYLPSKEVKNRCCVCLDGWKCEYSIIAGATTQHSCTPDWEPPDTTGN